MNITLAATAYIEFIGIIVLTANTPSILSTANQTTRQAILEVAPQTSLVAVMPQMPAGMGIPSHTPMIAFNKGRDDQTTLAGWTVSDLRANLSYIAVDPSDRITFTGMLDSTLTADQWSAAFPHLKSEWGSTANLDLQAGYKASSGYSASTGVVALTRGTVSACSPQNHGGRADTLVQVTTNGYLDVVAGSKHVRLRINDGDVITIANVPLSYAQDPGVSNGNHFMAYCAMANSNQPLTKCGAPAVPTLPQCPFTPIMKTPHPNDGGLATARSAQTPAPGVGKSVVRTPAAGRATLAKLGKGGVTEKTADVTVNPFAGSADCSNTAWP